MQPPNKTPRKAGKLAQGVIGFRHSEQASTTTASSKIKLHSPPQLPRACISASAFTLAPSLQI